MPSLIQSRPWPDILAFLDALSWARPFHAFIKRIAESRYAENVFAYTSMHTVVVAQTREIQEGQERLFLSYDPNRCIVRLVHGTSATFHFEDPLPKQGWAREVPPEEAFAAFERFLDHVGWVPGAGR